MSPTFYGLPGGSDDSPVPPVSEPRAPDAGRMQVPPGNPLLLSLTLQELLARDAVQVELVPEKKGLFLKHVEYEVSSQRFKSCVYRRYNDFVVFHETLLHKFPYRMVPALPPKRMLGADREFIEARRRALKRFINLVARHPPFSEDGVLKLFLSFSGPDVQNKLRESAQRVGDEFMTCKLAARAKDFLPADIQTQFAMSRELIRNIYNSFHKLRDRAERMVSRAIDNAADLLIFGKELSALGSDTTPLPSWASLNSSTWGSLKQALKGLSVEFALLADKAAQQGKQEENDVVEKLNLFLDLLQSYKDLCERHEKGVLHRHQQQLLGFLSTVVLTAAGGQSPFPPVLGWEARCPPSGRSGPVGVAVSALRVPRPPPSWPAPLFPQMSKVWNDLQPKLRCLFVGPHGAPAPPRLPQDGPSAH
ncbi:hypothetical protein K5549_010820 [Capra hircus]|nr:hypothetical protein K5549_010820 [Capra hircus]